MVSGVRTFRAIPQLFQTDEHEGRQFEDAAFSCSALLQPGVSTVPSILWRLVAIIAFIELLFARSA